jgi:hypothetical protein
MAPPHNQQQFQDALNSFWQNHPVSAGWSIVTERTGNDMKALILLSGNVVVTAYAHFASTANQHNGIIATEEQAIMRAISYLPPVS